MIVITFLGEIEREIGARFRILTCLAILRFVVFEVVPVKRWTRIYYQWNYRKSFDDMSSNNFLVPSPPQKEFDSPLFAFVLHPIFEIQQSLK